MSKHRRWLSEEQSRLRGTREHELVQEAERLNRIKQHAEFTAGLRSAILSNKPTSHLFGMQKKDTTSSSGASKGSIKDAAGAALGGHHEDELVNDSDDHGMRTQNSTALPLPSGPDTQTTTMMDAHAAINEEDASLRLDKELMDFIDDAMAMAKEKNGHDIAASESTLANAAAVAARVNPSEQDERCGTDASAAAPSMVNKHKQKSAGPSASASASTFMKPKWAQTAVEAHAQEQEEVDALLAFADDLDIDRYLDDLNDEERQGFMSFMEDAERESRRLQENDDADGTAMASAGGRKKHVDDGKEDDDEDALVRRAAREREWKKQFVRAVNHLANRELINGRAAPDADDIVSVDGARSRCSGMSGTAGRAAAARKRQTGAHAEAKWDSSTVLDSNDGYQSVGRRNVDTEKRLVAEDILRENPQFKSVHSSASVLAMMDNATKHRCNNGATGAVAAGDAAPSGSQQENV